MGHWVFVERDGRLWKWGTERDTFVQVSPDEQEMLAVAILDAAADIEGYAVVPGVGSRTQVSRQESPYYSIEDAFLQRSEHE